MVGKQTAQRFAKAVKKALESKSPPHGVTIDEIMIAWKILVNEHQDISCPTRKDNVRTIASKAVSLGLVKKSINPDKRSQRLYVVDLR